MCSLSPPWPSRSRPRPFGAARPPSRSAHREAHSECQVALARFSHQRHADGRCICRDKCRRGATQESGGVHPDRLVQTKVQDVALYHSTVGPCRYRSPVVRDLGHGALAVFQRRVACCDFACWLDERYLGTSWWITSAAQHNSAVAHFMKGKSTRHNVSVIGSQTTPLSQNGSA